MEKQSFEQIPSFNEAEKPEKMKLSGHEQGVMQTSNDALVTKVMAA
jgi:O-methyltransferase involved in polyketide biosynthesis